MANTEATARPEWADKIKERDFKGVTFYDILPLLADYDALGKVMDAMMDLADAGIREITGDKDMDMRRDNGQVDLIVSTESRGFLFGPTIATNNGLGFVPARKPGKTPGDTACVEYGKEYGEDALEMQKGLIPKDARVVIIDDLVASGGTIKATAQLIEDMGGKVVQIVTLIELQHLDVPKQGREVLEEAGYRLFSLLKY